MPKNVENFWSWVDSRMAEMGIKSYRQLEKNSGFARGSIGKRRNEHKFPTVEMGEGMCYALRVSWTELWTQAGFVDSLGEETFRPKEDQLTGLDAELYQAIRDKDDEFKRALLKTAIAWILYEELKK